MTTEQSGGVLVRQYADRLAGLLHTVILHPPTDRPFVVLGAGSRRAEAEVWAPVVADCLDVIALWLGRFRMVQRPTMRQGGAKGIDNLWREAAWVREWTPDQMDADWRTHGKAAGPIRNQAMVDKGADLCIGIVTSIESVGTRDCLERARIAEIPTLLITPEDLILPPVPPCSTW